jgi:hypothetical protein
MLTIGIDPDLHDTAIGAWNDGKPLDAFVAHRPRSKGKPQQDAVKEMLWCLRSRLRAIAENTKWEPTIVAVEAQTLQRTGLRQHKRPQDIVVLGNVAGVALAVCAEVWPAATLLFPTPEGWKGQIPKEVMQARLYDQLGWGYDQKETYSVPVNIPLGFTKISTGQWKHVGDALLIAKWAAEQSL